MSVKSEKTYEEIVERLAALFTPRPEEVEAAEPGDDSKDGIPVSPPLRAPLKFRRDRK